MLHWLRLCSAWSFITILGGIEFPSSDQAFVLGFAEAELTKAVAALQSKFRINKDNRALLCQTG
jgi:hypothetical protein